MKYEVKFIINLDHRVDKGLKVLYIYYDYDTISSKQLERE